MEELQEFLVMQQPTEIVQHIYWSDNATKSLIDCYKMYRKKVGSLEGTAKIDGGYWKGITKKLWTTTKKDWKGKKNFEYQEQFDEIYVNKRNIHPELLLATDTVQEMPIAFEISKQLDIAQEQSTSIPSTSNDRPIDNNSEANVTQSRPKRRKTQTNSTLELMRKDRKDYHTEFLKIQRERLEFEKEKAKTRQNKIQEMLEVEKEKAKARQYQNELLSERNEILKKYLEYKIEFPNDL
ncbi:hypothetical protein ANN_13734 [Periplaneta americana]|uniref:Uncharacterized protein n=1 Tax=Periplaneta americana TaxID=6978 RepID=A0ABQ8SVJ7_PERAM|nr:hypothetical protein ANN_13734 [Periplaneta americana]